MANSVGLIIPNSMGHPEPDRLTEITKNGKHVEIHTDRWHRCLGHVKGRKGGSKYNEYAVCTASIGVARAFKRGHGGGQG